MKMKDEMCAHELSPGKPCLAPAVAMIKWKTGTLSQLDEDGIKMGRGVASLWLPVCELHKTAYPDYDGVEL